MLSVRSPDLIETYFIKAHPFESFNLLGGVHDEIAPKCNVPCLSGQIIATSAEVTPKGSE